MKHFIKKNFPQVIELARRISKSPSFRYCYHRRPDSLDAQAGYSNGIEADDIALINRLVESYSLRSETPSGQWSDIFLERHLDIHDAITSRNRVRIEEILRKPATSELFYGFDNNVKSLHKNPRIEDKHAPALTLDALICLAEAIGVRRMDNPEHYEWRTTKISTQEIISQIENALQMKLVIPNPYPAERGLNSSKGIIQYRVPQAIYQAWRIAQLVRGISNPKVLEIGGGLGRTAFYAHQFGITDYTIIDIPISSLAQGYFLGRTLGDSAISLYGEDHRANAKQQRKIKLLPPGTFFESPDYYDLIVNVDSLTEIGWEAANQYWSIIQKKANVLLSINHESNDFTVNQLIKGSSNISQSSRMPYWMRRGYVEEVCHFIC